MPSINPSDQTTFQNMLANDPEIQAVTKQVWGDLPLNQRPSDTPKNLEAANQAASQKIGQILASRGVKLPSRTFINPRTMSLEGAHGWAGLPTAAKVAIIAGIAATGVGAGVALGAGGAAAAAGGGASAGAIPTIGATGGLAAGAFPAIAGTTGAGMATAGTIGTAAKTAGLVSKLLGGGSTLSKISEAAKVAGPLASGIAAGQQKGREATNSAAADAAAFKLKESGQNETGIENRAQLDLKQREDARTGQGDAYKKALQSALAMNMQDTKISGLDSSIPMVHFAGGARPSAIGAEGKAAAGVLNKQAMSKLLAGESFDELPALERTGVPEFKQPGMLENIAGGIGMAGNAINSVGAANEQKTYQQKILDAIESITKGSAGGQTALGPNKISTSGAAGVQPFMKPPTARFPPFGEVGDGDESNR